MMSSTANNLYDSLFNGKTKPLSSDLQKDDDALTAQLEQKIAQMSEEEKIAEFNRIMGR